jgi:hypothetical protein
LFRKVHEERRGKRINSKKKKMVRKTEEFTLNEPEKNKERHQTKNQEEIVFRVKSTHSTVHNTI